MRFKRLLAVSLVSAALTGVLPPLPASAAYVSFPDVTDPVVAEATGLLQALEIIGGVPGGLYHPDGTLTRAEFCKMAVCSLGRADEVPAYMGRTIFMDVGPNHWARGYINLASSISVGDKDSASPLITGMGNGSFQPDTPITYAQAVTILCRLLGYGVSDVPTGYNWYDGYLSTAASIGLTDGLALSADQPISRGQAAILFSNLYSSPTKDSKDSYLISKGGEEIKDSILLDANAENGTQVITNHGSYPSNRPIAAAYEGSVGTLMLDQNKAVLSFRPNQKTARTTVHLLSATAESVTTLDGNTITIKPETKVYVGDKLTTWEKGFADAKPYASLIFHYTEQGVLTHLYLSTQADSSTCVAVAMEKPTGRDPFRVLAGGDDYILLKNGSPITVDDIRQYDVAVYDTNAHVMAVSDLRISGALTGFEPQLPLSEKPKDPTAVTVMGCSFSLLPDAQRDLAAFDRGNHVTLLLTSDQKVARILPAKKLGPNGVGIVELSGSTLLGIDEYDNGTLSILPNGPTLKGIVTTEGKPINNGSLVSFTASRTYTEAGNPSEYMVLSLLPQTAPAGAFDIANRTIGGKKLAGNVQIFDRFYDGPLVPIPYSSLTGSTIPAAQITSVSFDQSGKINYVILNDATGDIWNYGIMRYFPKVPNQDIPAHWSLQQADQKGGSIYIPIHEMLVNTGMIYGNVPGGIVVEKDDLYGDKAKYTKLLVLKDVPRSAFDMSNMTLTYNGRAYPISDKVQIFNQDTQTWFIPGQDGLNEARTKSETLTAYYDRSPDQGGKIRVVIAGSL